MKLFLKGERCLTDKCSFDRKNYAPGQHGQRRAKLSEFGQQLREKQKVRRVYGVLERQFRKTFASAVQKRGITSEVFFGQLELRLDNVVYRMGFARSRQEAKQIVRHNHIRVNGSKVNIPSCSLRVGDEVSIAPVSEKHARFVDSADLYTKRPALRWLDVDHTKHVGKVIAVPTRDDIQLDVKERLVVELYSK
jgi:small subunit ribosomal protein S4